MSNALKFTVAGSVRLRTKLLLPLPPSPALDDRHISSPQSQEHNNEQPHDAGAVFHTDTEKGHPDGGSDLGGSETRYKRRPSMAVIRIEVSDTGVGLRQQDMIE